MKITGFNRVELLMEPDDIADAARVFNDLLGGNLHEPINLEAAHIVTTSDFDIFIECVGPAGPESRLHADLQRKGRGGIGPLVYNVEDIEAARAELIEKGYYISHEFYGPAGSTLYLDPEQLYGYMVAFTQLDATHEETRLVRNDPPA